MIRFASLVRCWILLFLLAPACVLAAAPECSNIDIQPTTLASGVVGTAYSETLSATTGNPPASFNPTAYTVDIGVLPAGILLNAATGELMGTPTVTGDFDVTIGASDANGCFGGRTYRLSIACGSFSIAAPPHALVGTAYNTVLVASGGSSPYTFTLDATSPPLPNGLTLAANGTLSGTPLPQTGGTYNLLIDVSDGTSCSGAPVPVTLIVDEAPTITSANAIAFEVGVAGSFHVTATGYPLPDVSETGALPSGVTFNATTGMLAGTPAAGTGGTYPITFTASNGVGTPATQSFTLTVNQPAAITSANATTFIVGSAGTFTVTATGFPAPTLAETGILPSGVTFNAATGSLSGTPAAGSGGTYPITFTATNGIGTPATQAFTLTVDEAPAITSANATTFTLGNASSFTVTATGFPTPTLAESGTLPAGITFNAATGVLSGTPAAGSGGTYPIVFTATNGVGTPATQNFTLSIVDGPVFTSPNTTTFTVGTAGTFTVTATGTPPPVLSETGTLPAGVTFDAPTGVLSGTPAVGTGGTYPITFTAVNSVGTTTQDFTLVVDEAPAITSANATTFTVGTAGSFNVTAIGHPTPTLSVTGTLPAGVTFTPATGVLAGTPAAGSGGTYALVFTATNGVGTPATQIFTLTIDQAPAITSANATSFIVGTAGTFTVTATGFPAPTLSESGALPAGVTFNATTGVLSGTPAAGTSGTYPITFTATNGIGTPATQNFTLTVNEAPQITSANATTFTIGAANSFTVTATGFPTPTLSESGALPAGVTFNAASGVLSGTPAAGSGGTYAIVFTATNGVGTPATQNFTLVVNQPPAITSPNATTFIVGTAGTFTVTATGFPPPILSESGALPAGVTFNAASSVLSGTPAAGSGGVYPITFTATNGVGVPATQSFTLTVNDAPQITSANSTNFPIGTADSFTVTSTGYPTPTLSETGTLPSGVTFADNGDGTGSLAGTPGAGTAGAYPITFSAANGVGTPANQAFTLTVTCPAINVSGTLPNGSYQVPYGPQTFTQTGGAAPIAWSASGLPSGLAINAGNGQVAGTPTTTTNGVNVTVTATDAYQCTGSLTVNNFKVLPVANDDSYTGFGNTQIYAATTAPATPYVGTGVRVTDNDLGPLPLTTTIVAPPAHGAVTSFTGGGFVFTPTAGYTGLDSFTYTITDANGVTSAPATVSLSLGTVVWYVNGANGTNGDGRSHNPFNTLASASTAHATGSAIFVHSGAASTTTPGAITLKASSTLWGQGTAFPLAISNTGATTKPLLTGTVTLGGNTTTVSSLDISTGASTGFTNTGTITGAVVQNNVNVTTTSGTAVNLNNASGNFQFHAVASNGAPHGINLAGVGGSFTVTGDLANLNNGAGGTIANSVGEGILYNGGGAALTFWQMNLTNSGSGSTGSAGSTGSGVKVTGANGFTLLRFNVSDNGGGGLDEGVNLVNTGGAIVIGDSTITGSPHNGVRIDNTSTNIVSFQLSGVSITNMPNNGTSTFGNDGLLFTIQGTTTVGSAIVQGNFFTNIFATGVQVQTGGTANMQNLTIGGAGSLANQFTGNNIALDLDQDNSSLFTFNVLNNTMGGHRSHAINVFSTMTSTGGSITGKIDSNRIGTVGAIDSGSAIGNGMRININGQTHAVVTVNNNTVNEVPNGRGIEMIGRLGTGGANFKATNNTVTRPTGTNQNIGCGPNTPCPLTSVYMSALTGNSVCGVISGNTAYDPTSWALGSEFAYTMINNASTMSLEGTAANATAQITNTNTVTNNNGAPVFTNGTINIVGAGTCGTFP